MTNERACANTPVVSRRKLLSVLPASALALGAPQNVEAETADPVVPLYHAWLEARREWRELAELPENGNFDDPRSLAAEKREHSLLFEMLDLTPTSTAGVAALAAVAWDYAGSGMISAEDLEQRVQEPECRAIMAIWKACTGKDGHPVI